MSRLWNAFIDRLVYNLTPKLPEPKLEPFPDPPLTPDVCQCGHSRCSHAAGRFACACASNEPDDKHDGWWGACACQIFIKDDDDDDDGDGEEDPTPSPEELEKMFK